MDMPFGKHKGRRIADIDPAYLTWALDNLTKLSPTLKREIQVVLGIIPANDPAELIALQNQVSQLEAEIARLNVFQAVLLRAKDGYKRLALACHPDRGGDTETMKLINEVFKEIRSMNL